MSPTAPRPTASTSVALTNVNALTYAYPVPHLVPQGTEPDLPTDSRFGFRSSSSSNVTIPLMVSHPIPEFPIPTVNSSDSNEHIDPKLLQPIQAEQSAALDVLEEDLVDEDLEEHWQDQDEEVT